MAINCIPLEIAEKLKEGIRNGDFDIAKMMEMESADVRAMLEKYVSKDMSEWAKTTFIGKDKKKLKSINEKIEDINDGNLLEYEKFLEDAISDKLGVEVTEKEFERITELANDIKDGEKKPAGMSGYSDEYFKAREVMENYINEINPSSNIRILTGTIGRASLLGPKSIVTNIAGNTSQLVLERLADRVVNKNVVGLNGAWAGKFIKENV